MRAKCRICGEPLDTNTAYLVVTNGKKAYFCSQEEYETEQQKKKKAAEDKDKVYRLICDIIARKEITNTALFAEWKVWNKVADNEKIGKYLEENKEYLCGVIAKLDNKEFNRIRYLSAILKNKLGDFKPSVVVREEKPTEPKIETNTRSDIGLRVNKKKKSVRRKGFAEMED